MKKFLFRFWPVFLLLLVDVVLFATNYVPHTYLVGWDNLMPELNIGLNLKRAFWAIWQDYRGLGLFDGMSHAATLPYDLLVAPLTIILPNNVIRYFTVFLAHFIGMLGVFFLGRQVIFKRSVRSTLASVAAAIFYGLNIGTVQMFYAPYETFTYHFAALPWLSLILIKYLQEGSKKLLLLLLVFTFVFSTQAHVPSVWLVYLLSAVIICGWHLVSRRKEWRVGIVRVIGAILIILVVNAYWLLPYGVAAVKMSPAIADSKMNQMSTQEITLRNDAFGDLSSVTLLKSYMFDFTNHDRSFNPSWFLSAWRDYFAQPLPNLLGVIWVIGAIIGAVTLIKRREKDSVPFLIMFVLMFLFLGSQIPVLGGVVMFLRNHVPLFGQVFRFAFTKFSTLYVFALSFLVGWGIIAVSPKRWYLAVVPLAILFVIYTLPSFKGNFLYSELKNQIPADYFQLWDYFKGQDSSSRVAVLPQPTFYGWTDYTWGARGSGFLWFGIPQPLMDRAFDPWSNENEEYYWELKSAVQNKDLGMLASVLSKYGINWVIADDTVSPQSTETSTFLTNASFLEKMVSFGALTIYKYSHSVAPVRIISNLPQVNGDFKYAADDLIYRSLGDYVSSDNGLNKTYLFPSLFSGKSQSDAQYQLKETADSLIFSKDFTSATRSGILKQPDHATAEQIVPVTISGQQVVPGTVKFSLAYLTPRVAVNGTVVSTPVTKDFVFKSNLPSSVIITLNNVDYFDWVPSNILTTVGQTYLNLRDSPTIMVYDSTRVWSSLPSPLTTTQPINCGIDITNSLVSTSVGQDTLKMRATAASNCSGYPLKLTPALYGQNLLFESNFEYLSSSDEEPRYCLTSPGLTHCFNSDNFGSAGFSVNQFTPLKSYAAAIYYQNLPATFSFVLEAPSGVGTKSIFYRNLVVSAHSLLLSGTLPSPVLTASVSAVSLRPWNHVDVIIPKILNSKYNFQDPISNNLYQTDASNCAIFPQFSDTWINQTVDTSGLVLSSKRGLTCQRLFYPNKSHQTGYLLSTSVENVSGLPLKIVVTRPESKESLLETYLSSGRNYLIIPPTGGIDTNFGMDFYNSSVGSELAKNVLESLQGYPLPYNFMKSLYIDTSATSGAAVNAQVSVSHVGSAIYVLSLPLVSQALTIVVSEADQFGWLAVTKAGFLLPVRVSNWSLGWSVPLGFAGPVLVLFWPQLLEQLGLLVFVILLIALLVRKPKTRYPHI